MNAKYFVPFKTAKLLKENGYPQEDIDYYYRNSQLLSVMFIYQSCSAEAIPEMLDRYYFAAPTYHEVVDWLEGEGIYITTFRVVMSYVEKEDGLEERLGWKGSTRIELPFDYEDDTDTYHTREEALNAAILKSIGML